MTRTVLLVLAILGLAVPAAAQSAARDREGDRRDPIAAEAAFDEARQLMKAGRYGEACPKLEASQRLDPGVGTLLNLGDCYEKNGQMASAWWRFREAASAAVAAGQPEREQIARARAASLDAKLTRLTLRVPPASDVGGLAITRNGIALDRALWGSAVPVDPGTYAIEASAPGKKTWTANVVIVAGQRSGATVEVPHLDDVLPAAPPIVVPPVAVPPIVVPPAAPAAPSATERPAVPPRASSWSSQKTVGVIVAGAGAVGLGVGAVFALSARATYADAQALCTPICTGNARQMSIDAGRSADVATALVIGGGVALAAGVLIFFTAPHGARLAAVASADGFRF